jgi:hypothetical protein
MCANEREARKKEINTRVEWKKSIKVWCVELEYKSERGRGRRREHGFV